MAKQVSEFNSAKPIHEITNAEIIKALSNLEKWFPSLNFDVMIDVETPDGDAKLPMAT